MPIYATKSAEVQNCYNQGQIKIDWIKIVLLDLAIMIKMFSFFNLDGDCFWAEPDGQPPH